MAGLERLLADPMRRVPAQYRSAWRLTGIKEATEAAPTAGARGSERP